MSNKKNYDATKESYVASMPSLYVPPIIRGAMQLQPPQISGTVTVSLAEMDQLRQDHRNAIRLAQELEERQAVVKIIVTEEKQTMKTEYRGRDVVPHSYPSFEYIQKSVEYKGFDEFREIIRQEEFKKIEKEFIDMSNSLDSNKKTMLTQYDDINKLIAERTKLETSMEECKKQLHNATEEIKQSTGAIEAMQNTLKFVDLKRSEYKRDLDELRSKKVTLWFWLKTKFQNIRDLK